MTQSDNIVYLDSFRPRRFAEDKDTEIAVAHDLNLIHDAMTWLGTLREICEHEAVPLHPDDRGVIRFLLEEGGPL